MNLGTETTAKEESKSETNDTCDEFKLLDSDSASEKDGDCSSVQNRNKYKELCETVDRYKVSNRDACLIVNAVLKDLNMLSPAKAIDPAKLRRQRIFGGRMLMLSIMRDRNYYVLVLMEGRMLRW